jgi:hypothetical protein
MTEFEIQKYLYTHFFRSRADVVSPNSCVYGYEADMIGITRNLFVHEIEIKISRSDFFADKKKDKHKDMKKWLNGERTKPYMFDGIIIQQDGVRLLTPPNWFWYAVPKDMIAVTELPNEWMGLIYIADMGYCEVIRRAKRLHKEPIEINRMLQISRSLSLRNWSYRLDEEYLSKRKEIRELDKYVG